MGSNEKFCLRWNDFESNISAAFREIREEKDFFDITLSCGQRQIQAHKLILSACSPFFRTVLKQNPHQHPLLYLKGVEFSDLQSVLNFMYHGEVNIAQEELNSFLSVAEELKVKGLTQNNSQSNSKQKPEHNSVPVPRQNRPSPRASEAAPALPKQTQPLATVPTTAPLPSQPAYQPSQLENMGVVKTEPDQPSPYADVGDMMEVARMDLYVEDGCDEYGGYEDGDVQEYQGQAYGAYGLAEQKGTEEIGI